MSWSLGRNRDSSEKTAFVAEVEVYLGSMCTAALIGWDRAGGGGAAGGGGGVGGGGGGGGGYWSAKIDDISL